MTPQPLPPPTEALQKARELMQIERHLPSSPDGYAYDDAGLYDKSLTEDVIGISNGELYMEKAEVEFIVALRNAFPSIHAELEKVTAERDELLKGYRGMREALCDIKNLNDSTMATWASGQLSLTKKFAKEALTSFPEIK